MRTGRIFVSLGFAAALLAAPAAAQTTPTRVRGTVERIEGLTLVVRTREGGDATIRLADNWTAGGLKAASFEDIKPGIYVGTAAAPQADGKLRALEVLVFPPGFKGNEFHAAWDLLPESTMTNATVAETVGDVSGRAMRMTLPGGDKIILVPPETPIVTPAPAERADVKPGAAVFVSAQKQPDGSLTAARVTVGNHGVAPPM